MQETRVWSLGQEDTLEKEIATHSSILVWEILWTEEPGWLQPRELQRVGRDWIYMPTIEYIHMLLLLLLSRFSRVRLCDPIDSSAPGYSRCLLSGVWLQPGIHWLSSVYDTMLPLQRAQVQSLVGELRFHKLHGTALKYKIQWNKIQPLLPNGDPNSDFF